MVYFQVHSFASPEITEKTESLCHIMNKGYNVPRFKYNIITTPRVKNNTTLLEDFTIDDPANAYLIFCFQEPDPNVNLHVINNELIEDAHTTRQKLIDLHPHVDLKNTEMRYDVSAGGDNLLNLPERMDDSLLGMICLKPHGEKAFEITGFISFYKNLGTKLIQVCELFAKERLNAKSLHITAIHEHDLRGMYEKWGFQFENKVLVPLCNEGISNDLLEDNIGATQDFHLDIMSKYL